MIKHDDVAGGRPGGGEEERVVRTQHRILGHEDVPAFEHCRQAIVLRNPFVGEGLLLLPCIDDYDYMRRCLQDPRILLPTCNARSLRIDQQLTRTLQEKCYDNIYYIYQCNK